MKRVAWSGRIAVGTFALASASLVMAQAASGAANLPVPEQPKEMAALGDVDAGCVMATVDAYGRARDRQNEIPAEKREEVLDLPMRQMAFYSGKVSARLGDDRAASAVKFAAGAYFESAKFPKATPTVVWCFRSYLDQSSTGFVSRMNNVVASIGSTRGRDLPAMKPEELDRDSLCFIMISIALPGTLEAAKKDPKAVKGGRILGRGQHFYMGRLYGQPNQSAVEGSLAKAYLYSDQLAQRVDNKTGYDITMSCLDSYEATFQAMLAAASAGLPPG